MAKSNLILEKEWHSLFCELPDEDAGKLIKAAFMCHEGEPVSIDDPVLQAVYSMVSRKIKENAAKYEQKCEQNARNRSAKSIAENKTEEPLTTVNDRKQSEVKDKVKVKEKDNNKLSFGEYGNVRMTAKEYEKLSAEFGEAKTDQAVKFLDEYIGDKGYKSKSHYLAIRRWVFDAVAEKKPTARSGTPGRFQNFQNRTDQSHKDMVAKLIAMQTGG